MKILTVIWSEFEIFKNKFWSITASSMISPILYMIAFGWGLGSNLSTAEGFSYIKYIVTGIIGMTTMTASYGAVANSLNIARTYDRTFEEFMTSPIKPWEYSLGKIIAGSFRGLYSALIITTLAIIFANLTIDFNFVISVILNCLVFASIGFTVGMIIDSHTDMNKFNSFIITPMSFLCGTFFPVDKMPGAIRGFVSVLPLSLTNDNLRKLTISQGEFYRNILVLIIYFIVFYIIGSKLCEKAE